VGLEGGFSRNLPLRLVVPLLVVALVGGAVAGGAVSLLLEGDGQGAGSAGNTRPPLDLPAASEDVVARVAAYAVPSVVTIINEQPPRVDSLGRLVESVSVGSGVIVDERGFIITNEHVIHDPGNLRVVLSDGEERPATLVSHDAPFTDLAVVRVPQGNLRALPFGDSGDLVPGQTVLAIGSALFEFRNSVSVGVVSGLGRRWLREGVYMEDLIQTDAAINSGNSGGPLINLKGEVVGVMANVVRRYGPAENIYGISFVISSRTILPIARSIIERGSFPRPYFGIDHENIDAEFAAANNLRVDRGALVRRVIDAGPADAAGIEVGDVILRIGRNDLTEQLPFVNALALTQIGETAPVQILRDGRVQEVMVGIVAR